MSDSGSGGNQFAGEVVDTVKEVAADVKDSVGEAIEQGVQSVAGPQLTSQQIQQKQLEDQKQLAETRRKIAWLKNVDQEQKVVRQVNKQKESQRVETVKQEKQVEVQQIQAKQQKKTPEEVLRSQAELRAGKGVGG